MQLQITFLHQIKSGLDQTQPTVQRVRTDYMPQHFCFLWFQFTHTVHIYAYFCKQLFAISASKHGKHCLCNMCSNYLLQILVIFCVCVCVCVWHFFIITLHKKLCVNFLALWFCLVSKEFGNHCSSRQNIDQKSPVQPTWFCCQVGIYFYLLQKFQSMPTAFRQ